MISTSAIVPTDLPAIAISTNSGCDESEPVAIDATATDSRRGALIFAIGALILTLTSALGLNAWPGQNLYLAISTGKAQAVFTLLSGFSIPTVMMFWGSRPRRSHQWMVVLTCPFITALMWWDFSPELKISWTDPGKFPGVMLAFIAMSVPCFLLQLWRAFRPSRGDATCKIEEPRLFWLFVLFWIFAFVPTAALNLTTSVQPFTFDSFLLHFDRATGLNAIRPWIDLIDDVPTLPELVTMCYGLTPLGFMAVALLQLRRRPTHVATGALTWVGISACALLAYQFFPATGPVYVFDNAHFRAAVDTATSVPIAPAQVGPFPRNAMPSMHFGWMLAACILWWRNGTAWYSRAILVTMTTLTAAATLYNGEHYVIDLIVAVPFTLAAIALCTTGVSWSHFERKAVVIAGFGSWLVWVLSLRHAIVKLVEQPWTGWLLIFATVVVVAFQARWTNRFKRLTAIEVALEPVAATATERTASRRSLRFSAMFFASGFAALVYQVLFAKELALVFGSTATATLTVLATFLGGMAIGSLIGGVLAQRVKRPLLVYAAIEFGIAMYCILTPQLFGAIQSAYVAMASGMAPDAAALTVMRVVLGAAVLLVPTVLMGTTLPLLARAIASADSASLGVRVAKLYFANTGGAALGALLTAYFVIPALGAHRTTLIAAVVNLMVALAAIELFKTEPANAQPADAETGPRLLAEAAPAMPNRIRYAALLALGVGGLLSLGLEVVYIHLLAIVAGNSVYAFGLMVATFLVGLSSGGGLVRPLLDRQRADPVAALAISLFGLCISAALGSLLWNGVPDYFGSFAQHPAATSFASREAIRAVICALLMIPPTLFIGAAYVLAIDLFTTTAPGQRNLALGIGAAVNTLGNIVGVLLFGFVVLPGLGGLGAAKLIAAAAMVLAIAVALIPRRPRRPVLAMGAVALLAVAISQGVQLNYDQISTGANVYFQPQLRGRVVAHAESIDGGLTTVNHLDSPNGPVLTLLTNGKFQGNDSIRGEMQAQVGFAFAPLLHQDHRDQALVIGYGTGVTSRAFHEAGFKKVDIAELSRDIVALADGHFESVNRRASTAPGVSLHLTDGRNFLLLSDAQYDVISLEISSIWFAGAASLYNQEFYRLAKTRLKADGVLQQWVQLHHLSQLDVLSIVATIRSEFRYVSLYLLGDQGILVATDDPLRASPRPEAITALAAQPKLAELRGVLGRPVASLVEKRLLNADGVDRFIKEIGVDGELWLSTDDNLRLEYDTPKGNVNDSQKSFQINKDMLTHFH